MLLTVLLKVFEILFNSRLRLFLILLIPIFNVLVISIIPIFNEFLKFCIGLDIPSKIPRADNADAIPLPPFKK
ncbi:hypothetical protein D3C76_1102220 [compost metagenome]